MLDPVTCGLRRTNIVKLFHISDSLYIVAYRLFYFDLVDLAEMARTIKQEKADDRPQMVEDAVPNPDYKPLQSFTLENASFLQDCDIYIDGEQIWLLVSTYNPEFFLIDFTHNTCKKLVPNAHPINQVIFLKNIKPDPVAGP